MADWVAFRLTGEARTDFTLASRTNALDPVRLAWADELLEKLGIESRLFAPLIANGAVVGLWPGARLTRMCASRTWKR